MYARSGAKPALRLGLVLLALLGAPLRAQIPCAAPDPAADFVNGWLASAPVRASLERLLDRAQYGLTPYEAAAWVVHECGAVSVRDWIFSGEYERASWNGPTPAGALAIVHTHPLRTDPRPSSGDAALARRLGLPVYTLTRHGLWAARPDGTIRLEAPAPRACAHLACLPWRDANAAETGASHPAL